jgi:hypothetical protein
MRNIIKKEFNMSSKVFIKRPVLLSILFLTSCSLTNPYVDDAKLVDKNKSVLCPLNPATYIEALKCSSSIKSEYISAMGDQANLSNWTGIGLIPLTAYTIGFALNGESVTKISDFALGSAGLFSLSNWLSAPTQTKVFSLGQKAIQCAEQVAAPLNLNSTSKNDLEGLLSEINEHMAILKVYLAEYPKESLNSEVESAIVEANKYRTNATGLLRKNRILPSTLVNAVRGINASVNNALSNNVQSLSALPSFLSGIGKLYESNNTYFAQYIPQNEDSSSNEPKLEGGTGDSEKSGGYTDREFLIKTFVKFQELIINLESLVAVLTPEASSSTFENCGLDTTNLSETIQANPSTLSFSDTTSTQSISISGGNGIYIHYADTSVFDIQQTPAFGSNMTIKVISNATGKYFITIKDSSDKTIQVPVLISKPQSDTSSENDDKKGIDVLSSCSLKHSLESGELALCSNKELTTKIQKVLNEHLMSEGNLIEVDGDYGNVTRSALNAFISNYNDRLQTEISDLNIQALLDFGNEKSLLTWST